AHHSVDCRKLTHCVSRRKHGRPPSARVTIGSVRRIEFVRTADPLNVWIAIDCVTDGKRVVTRDAEAVLDALISNSLHDIVNYRCHFCSHHFFLKRPKIEISENLRFLARSFSASCVLTCSVESKPNSRITKTNMIGVMLMASSIIDNKSLRRANLGEHRATDSRRRTRRKRPS